MKRPKPISGREFAEELPYIGEYFQPDDRVYRKYEADAYFDFLEEQIASQRKLVRTKNEKTKTNIRERICRMLKGA